jgi:4-amino-4-deoxy-L-arabinose transferase-like glycosyltransferase
MLTSKTKQILIFSLLAFIYFFLRWGWEGTIEFGYDQPWFSIDLISIIESGDFLNIGQYLKVNVISPDTFTWGPFAFYFFIPLFLLSRHPLVISKLTALLNFSGIILIYLTGKELFNKKVGIFAAFFLTVFPWSVIFSRMIYTPTPLFIFAPLSLYLTSLLLKKPKKIFWLILPCVWSMMISFHLISINLVFACLITLALFSFKKIAWKKFILGLILAVLPWLPFVKYEIENEFRFSRGFLKTPKHLQTDNQALSSQTSFVFKHAFKVLTGQDFEFQLGYGYKDFLNALPPWFFLWVKIFSLIFVLSLAFLSVGSIKNCLQNRKNIKGEVLILSSLALPVIFIRLFHLPEIVPRYFIMTLPSLALLIAWFFYDFSYRLKMKLYFKNLFFYSSLCLIILINSFFIIKYYDFLLKFSYDDYGWMGWLSMTSNPPFKFTYESLAYALKKAEEEGFKKITFSNNPDVQDGFAYNRAQYYIWQYVFKKDFQSLPGMPHYYLILGPNPKIPKNAKRFGPYFVYSL